MSDATSNLALARSHATLLDVAALPAADTLILTVNNRLARRLVQELAEHLRRERQVSELPRVLPLSAWLSATADELAFALGAFESDVPDASDAPDSLNTPKAPDSSAAPGAFNASDSFSVPETAALPAYRLDAFAARLLWVRAIADEEADRALLDMAQAAKLAADADTLMSEWRLKIPAGADTDEYRGYARWRARYRAALREIDAEDANRIYERVLDAARRGAWAAPRNIVLAGFTDESPRFAELLQAMRAQGAALSWLVNESREAVTPGRYVARDRASEWRAASAWAAQRLTENPRGRYAIVSAQLEDESPYARRVLGRALAAGGHAYNVAVGRPLTEWPAVRAALAWLWALARMAKEGRVEVSALGAALLAGHCAGDVREAARHAALDARWRRDGTLSLTQDQCLRGFEGSALADAWGQALQSWQAFIAQGPQTSDAWVSAMRCALGALGFPGERALDSVAYQVVGALGDLLGRYGSLAPAAGRLDGLAAVRLLESAAQESSFQPQRDPAARLDVLGLLEAEGGVWDGLWMLGLTDDVLPASPKPNPLLPLAVLRAAGAPRATPERERLWAEALYADLCAGAAEIIVSHARHEGESELRPSPLIAELPRAAWQMPEPAPITPLLRQTLDDERGPPLASSQSLPQVSRSLQSSQSSFSQSSVSLQPAASSQSSSPQPAQSLQPSRAEDAASDQPATGSAGGLDVLDTQARNPLWAFVRHRLGGRGFKDYALAADASQRGQFLHRALEVTWRMLAEQDQEHLHEAIIEKRLDGLLRLAIAQAADEFLGDYGAALRELECQRAQTVLTQWFDLEAQRAPFKVDQVEQTHTWTHGALRLSARLDRLDRLGDGRAVIIDYKTGMSPGRPESDWARTRPVNLQLPFYASVLAGDASKSEVAALVLAQIHARQVAAQGLGDDDVDLGLDGVKAARASKAFENREWPAILAGWRTAIEGLASEYASGYAANITVDPKDLEYCDAMPFLRLDLESVDFDEEGEDGEGA